jgi:predicted dehydrogenase
MAETIRLGVVGFGRILPAHLRGLRLLREAGRDDFRVTALVARRLDDALMFRRKGEGPTPRPPASANPDDALGAPHLYVSEFQPEEDAQVFASAEEMLAAGVVDAVSVTASLVAHHEVGLPALELGKHLMLEKPLAISIAAGRSMLDVADRRGLSVGVMEVVRYDEVYRAARWAIERGDLGEIQMLASVAIGTGEWSPDRVVGNTPWRHRKLEAGGGASLDIGVHVAHAIRYLAGEARSVSALARTFEPQRTLRDASGADLGRHVADVDDAFFALLDMENGAAGMLSFTWAGHGEPTSLPGGLTLYGTRGCLKGPLLVRDDGTREDVRELFLREADGATQARVFPWGTTDRFGQAYDDWFDAIRAGGQPETSGEEGLRDLATAFAIPESSLAGGPVAVADVLSGRVDAYQREINSHFQL